MSSYTTVVKLHRKVIDVSALKSPLPQGVCEMGDWIVFQDINYLFSGMCEMYTPATESEKRSRLFYAVRVLQEVAASRATVSDDGGMAAIEYMISNLHFP
jgi:hypothetical protein